MIKKPKFKIGNKVFHITPESDCGVVLDVRFSYLTGLHEYYTTFAANTETLWYYEHELSDTKIYNSKTN